MIYGDLESVLPSEPLLTIETLPFAQKIASGKVREIFDCGEELLIIASDRLSAFDVILPDGIPGKGIILTQVSLHWFAQCNGIIDNHLVPDHEARLDTLLADHPELRYRSMLVRKLEPLPVEAIARAYLSGSGWKEYQNTGKLFDHPLPEGLRDSDALPQTYFTPTTKANEGHDMPISEAQCAEILGDDIFQQVKEASLHLFQRGTEYAQKSNLILADTKFEFGTDSDGKLYLIDEILTPDSSRYWNQDDYQPGQAQKAFDKQFVRDYLESLDWDKTPPGPQLPQEIIQTTLGRYLAAAKQLLS